jgi:hypothetical protein
MPDMLLCTVEDIMSSTSQVDIHGPQFLSLRLGIDYGVERIAIVGIHGVGIPLQPGVASPAPA